MVDSRISVSSIGIACAGMVWLVRSAVQYALNSGKLMCWHRSNAPSSIKVM